MKLFLLFIMVSCASSMGKVVIERMDDVDEKPSWATLSKPYFQKGEKTFVIGFAEASGTSIISLLNDIASNNGKNRLARYVETEMLSVFQNSIDGVENRNEMARKYASEKSSLYLREIIEENIY